MKKLLIVFLAIIISLISFVVVGYVFDSTISSKLAKDFNIIGTWESKSGKKEDKFKLTFYKDGQFKTNFLKTSRPQDESRKGQDNLLITYTVNYNKSPLHLDIIVTNVESNKSKSYEGIIKVEGRDHMKLALDTKGKRPKFILFSSHIKLVRVK